MPDNTKCIKILFWNVNRRLNEIVKNISPLSDYKPDIVFVMETSIGYEVIPNINGYTKYADKNIRECSHGGIAFYLTNELASHVFNINFNTSFISFRLDFIPEFLFIGSYIQPEKSKYFDPYMFSELCSFLVTAQQRKLIPIMGGDVNCRFGDLNVTLGGEALIYEMNVALISNKHGLAYGKDMCKIGGIFPLNHLVYKNKAFKGGFTYFKANNKSQLDYTYYNKEGLKFIKNVMLHENN